MKRTVWFIMILAIMTACSTMRFQPCRTDKKPSEIETEMLPVTTGNKWVYQEYVPKENTEDNPGRRTIEIGELDTLKYEKGGSKHDIAVYRLHFNGVKNKYFAYLKCEDRVILAETYSRFPNTIYRGRTIPENPEKGWKDPLNSDVHWRGPETVETPAGTFECWVCEWLDRDLVRKRHREYYSRGVGMVKSEIYTYQKKLIARMELESYDLKE